MIDIELVLPGELTDPNWPGVRCKKCGRPMGGNKTYEGWATCNDVPQVCTALEDVPKGMIDSFYLKNVWSNAYRFMGLGDAMRWMLDENPELNGAKPLDLVERGDGATVYALQFRMYPQMVEELKAMRGIKQ